MRPLQARFQYLNTHLYLLLHAQHCCHLPVEKVANKIKVSLHSKQRYQED